MWPQGSSGPPNAVMQLVQSLQAVQAASGMPQQRTAPQQPGRSAELDTLSQLLSAHQQQAQQPGSQLGGTSQGPSSLPSAAAPSQQAGGSVNDVKDLIARLLGQPPAQQLQPQQQQPEQPPGMLQLAVPDQSWSAPSPHSNNSVTVPQHSMLPAPGMRDLQQQPQQRPAQQDNSIVQLCCTLLEVLQAKGQQQPQPAGQMQAPPPQHQPPAPAGVPSPVAQALAAAMPSQQVNAAALAAAAGFTTPQNLAAYTAAAPAAAAHRPAPAYPGPMGSAPMVPPPPQQPQQQAPAMPALLEQLRAAIGSHAPGAGSGGGQTPDQQRLMGVVDQLQAAWASLGGRDPAAAAGQTTSAAGAASGAGAAAASSAAAGASAEDLSRASGLNMLLAAVQQQVAGTPAGVTHPLVPSGAPGQLPGSGYAMGVHPGAAMYGSEYAAAGWGHGWDQDPSYMQHQPYHHHHQQQQQSGGPGRKHDWEAEYRLQQQQLAAGGGGLVAAVAAAMMQEEGMMLGASLQDSVIDPTVEEQKFLLKPRARGKRQVKPNQVALTGELPPVYERWAHKGAQQQQQQQQQQRVLGRALSGGAVAAGAAAAAAGGDSSDDDELWRPPRSRASRKRRRTTHGQGSEDGTAAASATSPGDQQGAAAAGAPKGAAGTARRGYGWQLLQSQEQQPQQPREREDTASPVEGTPEGGWTGGDGVTEGLGRSYSCTVSGMDRAALEVTPDGGSEDAGGSEGGPASASAGTDLGAGGKARARKPAVKRDRWVPPTEEWTSEDGLKVMPKDTQICPGARVFYVQYKWVQEYWPNALATPDNHIASHPAHFYLDGHETDVQLTAKLRLYRKAVHLVISPYSALAKKFVRKWLAGYAFDQERQVMRIYLSTLKPKPPKLEVAEPDPAEITAAAAAAAEWAATAAAQFAAGPVGADAQQQLASQLAALANMLQPKGKASKDSKRSAAAGLTTQPLQRPQDVLQLPQPGQAAAAAAAAGAGAAAGAEAAAGAQQLQPAAPAPQALPQQQDQQDQQQPELAQGPQPPAASSEALVEPQMPQQQPFVAASAPSSAAEHEQRLQEAAGAGLSTPPSPTAAPQQQQQQALPGAPQPEPATGEAPQAAEGGALASPQEVAQEVSVSEGPPASGHSPGCSAPLEPAGTTQQ